MNTVDGFNDKKLQAWKYLIPSELVINPRLRSRLFVLLCTFFTMPSKQHNKECFLILKIVLFLKLNKEKKPIVGMENIAYCQNYVLKKVQFFRERSNV